MTEGKNWLTSIIGDKEFDPDAAKILGILLCIVGCVGFFRGTAGTPEAASLSVNAGGRTHDPGPY